MFGILQLNIGILQLNIFIISTASAFYLYVYGHVRLKIKICLFGIADRLACFGATQNFFSPFWNVLFFYSVCLAFRFIMFSYISVHSNTMHVYASIKNRLDAC